MTERWTAEDLGIHPKELEALIWVRDALDPSIPDHNLPGWMTFDMDSWASVDTDAALSKCGTSCCIGGSMEIYLSGMFSKKIGDSFSQDEYQGLDEAITATTQGSLVKFSDSLNDLFFTYSSRRNTREEGVAAIDRFLAGNTNDPWLVKTSD